jgi:heterodisulfide reductase subunit B
MTTAQPVALKLAGSLLETAAKNGAHCVVTCCPLCQFNLDAYQGDVNRLLGTRLSMPVLFFTQLVGVALGLSRNEIMLGKEMVPAGKVLAPYMNAK